MRKFIENNDKLVTRLLEILPGFFSWNLILFPYWGILVFPNVVAYFILIFNLYWFYQSFHVAISATFSHFRIQAAMKYDWMSDVQGFPDYKKIHNFIIIPMVNEPMYILERTFDSLVAQTLPSSQITVVLATEARVPEAERLAKINPLIKKYGNKFANLFVTAHPLLPGEIIGKASNERHAAIETRKKFLDTKKFDMNYAIVTSCDSDHKYHPNHFACLTFKFLDNPERYKHFWQPAVLFYNNIWELPPITRVVNTLNSIWNLSLLARRDRLINAQNYSLSFKLLHEAGYWDADKVPEDWGIFFKALYEVGRGVEVEPIYLPLYADSAQSTTIWKTLKLNYEQLRRWAYGVSDTPWMIKNYLLKKNIPFWDKTTRMAYALWSHFMWPVNWFFITIGLTLPTLLNPAFGRTTLGYMVPKVSSFVLSISLLFLLVCLVVDFFYKPKLEKNYFLRVLATPFELILMPIAGFFFSALPGIDAHTRLMLGKYMEHKVTEKV